MNKTEFEARQKLKEYGELIAVYQDKIQSLERQLKEIRSGDIDSGAVLEMKKCLARAVADMAYRSGYDSRAMGYRKDPERVIQDALDLAEMGRW